MICHETQRLLDAYVDNELDLRGALEMEEHLAHCPGCSADEKGLRELQAVNERLLGKADERSMDVNSAKQKPFSLFYR